MEDVSGASAEGAAWAGVDGEVPKSARLRVHLLGPVQVCRDDVDRPLPRSRKVRALLTFLVAEPLPKSRSRLCDLLWSEPSDPRGELRWCLSKLRSVLDDRDRQRVVAAPQSLVSLDLSDCLVDVTEVDRCVAAGIGKVATGRLAQVADLFSGDLADGLELDAAEFSGWLAAQRQRYRAARIEILAELVRRLPGTDGKTLRRLDAWLQLAPFDPRPHQAMIEALAQSGRKHDAEAYANRTIHSFEQEGVDWSPVRATWQALRESARSTIVVDDVRSPEVVAPSAGAARPGSVLVMPFAADASDLVPAANGLTDDLITCLAKLRVFFVMARGTSYVSQARGMSAAEAGRVLDVAYVVSGRVLRQGEAMAIHVELAETRTGRVLWADRVDGAARDALALVDSSISRIVAAIAEQIEQAECKRVAGKLPSSLDAWDAYHRGLWHMYLFTGSDNERAAEFFRAALTADPTFARAHAGLSFTHFQNVFLGLRPDRQQEVALALWAAQRGVAADDRDPAAHWAMGRALWLAGDADESVVELERSVELSPAFALGHYTLGFVLAQSGDPKVAIAATDHSRALSPFDPLQFAMLASRALAHLRLGQSDEAVAWAVRASRRPNAHVHILAIAATGLALADRREPARAMVGRIRAHFPTYDVEEFLRAFRFSPDLTKVVRQAARRIGFG